jgi:hypothetical protein
MAHQEKNKRKRTRKFEQEKAEVDLDAPTCAEGQNVNCQVPGAKRLRVNAEFAEC